MQLTLARGTFSRRRCNLGNVNLLVIMLKIANSRI